MTQGSDQSHRSDVKILCRFGMCLKENRTVIFPEDLGIPGIHMDSYHQIVSTRFTGFTSRYKIHQVAPVVSWKDLKQKKSYSKDEDIQNSLPTKNHKSLKASYIGMISLPVTVGNAGSFIEMLGSPTRNDILQLCIQSPTSPQRKDVKSRGQHLLLLFGKPRWKALTVKESNLASQLHGGFQSPWASNILDASSAQLRSASVWATRTNVAAGSPTSSSRWANTKKL